MGNLELCEKIIRNIIKEKPENLTHYSRSAIENAMSKGHWNIVEVIGKHCKEFFGDTLFMFYKQLSDCTTG